MVQLQGVQPHLDDEDAPYAVDHGARLVLDELQHGVPNLEEVLELESDPVDAHIRSSWVGATEGNRTLIGPLEGRGS